MRMPGFTSGTPMSAGYVAASRATAKGVVPQTCTPDQISDCTQRALKCATVCKTSDPFTCLACWAGGADCWSCWHNPIG